jgi:glycosyltransferase involved in cell wall biosynthesis
MSCGTPVITSNRSSLPEITGNAAILTDLNRPGDIAQAINRIISDPRLHQHLSEKSRAQASQFNWRNTAQNFLRILESQS